MTDVSQSRYGAPAVNRGITPGHSHRLWIVLAILGGYSSPSIHGNENGGMIDWAFTNEERVFQQATAFCAQYGKKAKITDIKAVAGGHVLFDCL